METIIASYGTTGGAYVPVFPPIVGPNPGIVDLNFAFMFGWKFLSPEELARVSYILNTLQVHLIPQEAALVKSGYPGLQPLTIAFDAAELSARIKRVLSLWARSSFAYPYFTPGFVGDLQAIADRVEGRFGVPFVGTLDAA